MLIIVRFLFHIKNLFIANLIIIFFKLIISIIPDIIISVVTFFSIIQHNLYQ